MPASFIPRAGVITTTFTTGTVLSTATISDTTASSSSTSTVSTSAAPTVQSVSSSSITTVPSIDGSTSLLATSKQTPSLNSTSASSASPATKTNSADNENLSTGAVAGIGVGTFFAGVLLALLCVCIFAMLRKKRRRSYGSTEQQQPYRDSDHSQGYGTPMKQMTSPVQPMGTTNDINLNRILLEPVSSSDIKRDMLAIGSQIMQHIDNNYHLKPVNNLPEVSKENLELDGYVAFTGILIEQLGNLLRNVQTRRAAIRHLISYFIFSNITFTSNIENSLLPTHIIAFLKQMPPPERTNGSREAFDQALTKWRRLSAYLLQAVRSSRDPLLPQDNDIRTAITHNVTAVRQILMPFVIPGAESRQVENLQGLMAEGAKLGLLLFQHPESWEVDWEAHPSEDTDIKTGGRIHATPLALIIFPGLIKTTDEEGRRYAKARAVLKAEVLQI